MTRVFSLPQIEWALGGVDVVAAMERAFVAYSSGRAVVPPVGELLFDKPPGDAHIKYGYVRDDNVFVIKVATGFYENPRSGLPANSGLMLVFSAVTGAPIAVLLDEGHLTNVRTAAAGAVAAKYLAPAEVRRIGVLGTGVQAQMQVEFLRTVTPCRDVVVWGRSRDNAAAYAARLSRKGYRTELARHPADVAATCNLIVTATIATQPLLSAAEVRAGTHITAMGSDTPTKNELATDVLRAADVCVVDSLSQCRERGELHHALLAGAIAQDKAVELGKVVAGHAKGRTDQAQITVCDLTGVAVQDIEISKAVLARLERN
ncbi:MAG: ornithine cyclodeaminase family protein [Steroidobacteraceae bacterium]